MATIYCVCGPVASGKSTYSTTLAKQNGAIVFSIDKWMNTLFGKDIPVGSGPSDFAWFSERVDGCEEQSWQIVEQLLRRDVNVVLDWGFIRRERRNKVNQRAAASDYKVEWHVLESDKEVRRERLEGRNENGGATFAFQVTPAMFDFAERLYEPPQKDELPSAIRSQS
ncbi:MAG: ATP-binding protein [Acidobacteria bacterium]|nr:ATP-binding protein [Acidobacteriota bacterium]